MQEAKEAVRLEKEAQAAAMREGMEAAAAIRKLDEAQTAYENNPTQENRENLRIA